MRDADDMKLVGRLYPNQIAQFVRLFGFYPGAKRTPESDRWVLNNMSKVKADA